MRDLKILDTININSLLACTYAPVDEVVKLILSFVSSFYQLLPVNNRIIGYFNSQNAPTNTISKRLASDSSTVGDSNKLIFGRLAITLSNELVSRLMLTEC